jgi:SAM-dependent methyltransferase
MSVFGANYSEYYDLFYADKDYAAEAAFVRDIIERYKPGARSILDLGCGSGRHAVEFARAGLMVTGVERSGHMIARAKDQIGRLSPNLRGQLTLVEGDATTYTSATKYDVVVALFHVVSYQTTNEALQGIFNSARVNLIRDGLFVFDFWYGPAVLTERPQVRVKRVATSSHDLIRIAEPEHQVNRNVVDVRYTLTSVDRETGLAKQHMEMHSVRYLFLPEIELLASYSGFEIVEAGEWLIGTGLDEHCWSGCVAARVSANSE